MPVKKPKLTAEELFLEKWNEFGYANSDIKREFRFHPTRKWRFDFAFPSRKVAIEIDGRGRHQTVVGVRSDCEKANHAAELGWVVLHLPTTDIRGKLPDGEPLVERFIELVCRILSTRENYSVAKEIHQRVAELQEVPTPSKCPQPRSISRVRSSGSSPNRRSSRQD